MGREDMLALAERVESLTGPDRGVDRAIWYALQDQMSGDPVHGPRFTADLDAAMSLVPEGWTFDLQVRSHFSHAFLEAQEDERGAEVSAQNAATPALALTAAALKARAEVQP
jgi:hypothetical protein